MKFSQIKSKFILDFTITVVYYLLLILFYIIFFDIFLIITGRIVVSYYSTLGLLENSIHVYFVI